MNQELITLATRTGYQQSGYGYCKDTKEVRHWITFFTTGGLQMYGYLQYDVECEKIYDTGILEQITESELRIFISSLLKNHN